MNWKVGDKFWVDYEMIERVGGTISLWKEWFPPSEQPFRVSKIRGDIIHKRNARTIPHDFIYADKNFVVTSILNDL